LNYDEHVLAGILTYPIAILILSSLNFYLGLPLDVTFLAMALGYAFYVLGSDLPDMDHPEALIRNWPVLRKYWNLSEGITWDVDAPWWQSRVAQYRRACAHASPRCREILALLGKAAQAAATPE